MTLRRRVFPSRTIISTTKLTVGGLPKIKKNERHVNIDKLYSPQMVVTANITKYTIENDLTKKRKNQTLKRRNKLSTTQATGLQTGPSKEKNPQNS